MNGYEVMKNVAHAKNKQTVLANLFLQFVNEFHK